MSEAMPTTGKRLCEERACWLLDRKQASEVSWGRRQTPRKAKQCVRESGLSELSGNGPLSYPGLSSQQPCAEHPIPGRSRTSAEEGGELQPQSGTQGFQTAMGFYLFLI